MGVQLSSQAQTNMDAQVGKLKSLKEQVEEGRLPESALTPQYTVVADAESKLDQMKRETDAYVKELTSITDIHHKVAELLLATNFTRALGDKMKAFTGLQERLCGDISSLSLVAGRRQIASGEVCIMMGGQLRNLTIFLFNDIIVTTAQGSSREFEIFQNKIELYRTNVEAVGARLKLVEQDPISGMEKASYTFECDTEETAIELCMQIEVAILAITRSHEVRVKDETMANAETEESLTQINERLRNEVHNMRERERGVEAKLRKQMASFVELRSQQWENDYERVQNGLTVDPRTLNVLQKQGGVTRAAEQGEVPDGEEYDSNDNNQVMAGKEKEHEKHDFDARLAKLQPGEKVDNSEGKGEVIAGILDKLLVKFEALQEVVELFTHTRMITDEEREQAAAAAAAATEKGEEGDGGEDGAAAEEGEAKGEASDGGGEDDAAVAEEAAEGDQADQFWEVIQRVRGALGVLGGKMSELDERFWDCRMGATGNFGKELGFEGSHGGMTASEMAEEMARVQEEIAAESKEVTRLTKERDELQEVTDNSLRNLQNVGKVAHQLHKK